MKKLLSILLALAMLASLTVPAFADEPDYTTGTPWLCIDLDGVVTADTPADLKDNYALAVNKDKILALEIPEGRAFGGTTASVALKQAEDIKNMFLGDAPEGHDARLAYDLFQLMMDWDSRNALGVAPLKEQIAPVEAIDSIEKLSAYFVETRDEDELAALYYAGSDQDQLDSNRYVLAVSDAGLLLGDAAEYEKLTDFGAIKKDAITELARKMLVKLGYTEDEAQRKIDNCFAFETMLAPALFTDEEKKKPDYLEKILNFYSYDEMKAAEGPLPILEDLAATGFPETDRYQIANPDGLKKLIELYTDENLPLIKDYLIVHGTLGAAGSLDRECYEWNYAASNAISGASGMLDDETMFSGSVASVLAWPVAQLYTQTYLRQEDKDRIMDMMKEILDVYHGIIEEADFLSDATREKAIEKLDAIKPRSLYPDSWEKYNCDGLDFDGPEKGGTLWEAYRRISAYMIAKSIKEFPEPVDKEKWPMPPTIVNCFYDWTTNTITILGAFAQGGLYSSDMSDEEVLAKLGCVIGHEISHGFDSTGAQFDKYGNMADWWTEEDYAEFLARNQKMVDYYNAMHPWEGQDFYGSIMTGEACADMAGMKAILRLAAERENFDYDAFFRAFADIWLEKGTLQSAYMSINNVHPMSYLRINCTLQQFDEFLDCYGITEGDNMYLAPEDRVAIW
ncbi:MAG: M13 family metallopeptidase [Oscillospiraceae bacterium]|nr:M13 family metallopeptidase [Oscillospiraceae bacterium]